MLLLRLNPPQKADGRCAFLEVRNRGGNGRVLSSYDNVLDFLTISSETRSRGRRAHTRQLLEIHTLIAPDAHTGRSSWHWRHDKRSDDLQSISTTSPYAATTITPNPALPAGFLASGILVSDDGSTIYVAGFNCTDATKTPMFHTIANP